MKFFRQFTASADKVANQLTATTHSYIFQNMLDTTVRVLLEEDPEGMLQAAQNEMDTGIPVVGKRAETHRAKVLKRYRSIVETTRPFQEFVVLPEQMKTVTMRSPRVKMTIGISEPGGILKIVTVQRAITESKLPFTVNEGYSKMQAKMVRADTLEESLRSFGKLVGFKKDDLLEDLDAETQPSPPASHPAGALRPLTNADAEWEQLMKATKSLGAEAPRQSVQPEVEAGMPQSQAAGSSIVRWQDELDQTTGMPSEDAVDPSSIPQPASAGTFGRPSGPDARPETFGTPPSSALGRPSRPDTRPETFGRGPESQACGQPCFGQQPSAPSSAFGRPWGPHTTPETFGRGPESQACGQPCFGQQPSAPSSALGRPSGPDTRPGQPCFGQQQSGTACAFGRPPDPSSRPPSARAPTGRALPRGFVKAEGKVEVFSFSHNRWMPGVVIGLCVDAGGIPPGSVCVMYEIAPKNFTQKILNPGNFNSLLRMTK